MLKVRADLTGMELSGMAIDVFTAVIFGTAAINSVIAFLLYPVLKRFWSEREGQRGGEWHG